MDQSIADQWREDRAPVDQGISVDLAPPPIGEVEECDQVDNDLDGAIDEGVSNPCGGCGELEEGGCEAWSLSLGRPVEGLIDPSRVLSLGVKVSEADQLELEGARCNRLTVALESRVEVGSISIESASDRLVLSPQLQGDGQRLYRAEAGLDPRRLFEPLDSVLIQSEAAPPLFEPLALRAPMQPTLEGEGGLAALRAQLRGGGEAETPLRWQVSAQPPLDGERLRLYGGGSVPIFNRNQYRALRHYLLSAELEDDGDFELPVGVSEGVPESAIWVYLSREQLLSRAFGPRRLVALIGAREELREGGRLSDEEAPMLPFQLVAPTPDQRQVDPSLPLRIQWTPPPPVDAVGPSVEAREGMMSATLLLYDYSRGSGVQIRCAVESGVEEVEIPSAWLEAWPRGDDSLRQLTLSWLRRARRLPAPDRGRYQEYVSIILRLEGR